MTKKLIGFTSVAIILAGMTASLTAAPFAKKITFHQPNGTVIELWGEGDDFHAVFETLDGYTVVFDPNSKSYQYATLSADGSELLATGMQVGQGHPLVLGIAKHLRINAESLKRKAQARFLQWDKGMEISRRWNERKTMRRQMEQAAAGGPALAPPSSTTTGNKIGLTLLIDFDNDPATISQTNIVDFLNGDSYTGYGNNGSVKKYFYDNANGLLTYSNVATVYIRIPNTLHPKSYYNDITQDAGNNANLLIRDAITIMKALPNYTTEILPTFNNLTVDASSNVVACNVFYAGGNGGVWAMGLWPHSWSLWNVGAQALSAGGKNVFRYQITDIGSSLEIGTFCHENGHMLCDFPDLYDYTYTSIGGAGVFSLMGYGGYATNPAQVDAYLKRAAGWATITELTSISNLTASLTASAGPEFNHFYRFQKPSVATEYFLVENRQRAGRDALIAASGIAIWHVDELGNRDNSSLITNSVHANYELTLVQADNLWHFQSNINSGDSRDLYYSGNLAAGYSNRFADNASPSARWWNGSLSDVNFHNISSNGDTMTFVVGEGGMGIIPSNLAYTAFVGMANPTTQTFVVINDGATAFNFTNTVRYSSGSGTNIWFTPSVMTGLVSAAGSLTVTGSVNITGLNTGVYYATNTFTAAGVPNSPQLMVVTLQVFNPLKVVPSTLTYFANLGSTNPAAQTFVVTNEGPTAFNFTNTMSYSSGSDTNIWFTPSVMTGFVSAAGSLTVTGSVNITNLPVGTHYATNTFTATGATNSPQLMVATLQVFNPAQRLWLSTPNIKAVTEGQGTVWDTIQVANTGTVPREVLTYALTTTSAPPTWLSVNPTNGWVQDNINTVMVAYATAGLAAGWYTGQVYAAAVGDVGDRSVDVVLRVNNRPGVAWDAGSKVWTNDVILSNNLAATTVAVWNASGTPVGRMSYEIYADENPFNWVSVSPASGVSTGDPQQATVSYTTTGLAAGEYTARLKVEGRDEATDEPTTNGPLFVWLKLTVKLTGTPVLRTDQASLSRTVLENTNATSLFRVWNGGDLPHGSMRYTATPNVDWVSVNSMTGVVANGTNTVSVVWNAGTLPLGVYSGSLVVDAWDANTGTRAVGAPMTIPLTMTIAPRTPQNLELPEVIGSLFIGQTVEAYVGLWHRWQNQGLTFSYQWKRAVDQTGGGQEVLSGQTMSNYLVTVADSGKYLRVSVTATDDTDPALFATADSAWTNKAKVKALHADWNRDGITDLWFYDQPSGTWSLNFGAARSAAGVWPGLGPDMDAAPGDYDGDGNEDLGVYDRAHGMWYVLFCPRGVSASGSLMGGTVYEAEATSVPADYDGDGATDLAFYWMGYWVVLHSSTWSVGVVEPFAQGVPVMGDWDGDGITKMGVYANGIWTLRLGNGDVVAQEFGGGGAGVLPALGDYDGDGVTDLGVHDVNANEWRWQSSWTGSNMNDSFGPGGGWPIPGYYDHDRKEDFAQALMSADGDFIVWLVRRTAEPTNYPYLYHGQSYQRSTGLWRVNW